MASDYLNVGLPGLFSPGSGHAAATRTPSYRFEDEEQLQQRLLEQLDPDCKTDYHLYTAARLFAEKREAARNSPVQWHTKFQENIAWILRDVIKNLESAESSPNHTLFGPRLQHQITPNHILKPLEEFIGISYHFQLAHKAFLGPAQIGISEFSSKIYDSFANECWPCEFVGPSGGKGGPEGLRCSSTRNQHRKNHMTSSGIQLDPGKYQASLKSISKQQFISGVTDSYNRFKLKTGESLIQIQDPYMEALAKFYRIIGGAQKYINRRHCVTCFTEPPDHKLLCRHLMCTICFLTYAYPPVWLQEAAMEFCPIEGVKLDHSPPLLLKPVTARARVLSLDGGNFFQTVIQTEIIRAIRKQLGPGPQFESFFDLIVGTGSGGLLALQKSEDRRSFVDLLDVLHSCSKGATTGSDQPQYDKDRLLSNLREICGDEILLGSNPSRRVAVVSAMSTRSRPPKSFDRPIVFANYDREVNNNDTPYIFHTPQKALEREIQVWESAWRTFDEYEFFGLTTPGFSSDISSRPNATLNSSSWNPVLIAEEERKRIWPKQKDEPPEIMLSIGSGIYASNDNQEQSAVNTDSCLYFEAPWQKFIESIGAQSKSDNTEGHYIRLNVDINSLHGAENFDPHEKQRSGIDNFREVVSRSLAAHSLYIQAVADSLISSSFFFEVRRLQYVPVVTKITKTERSVCKALGTIMCRFQPFSKEIRQLYSFFNSIAKSPSNNTHKYPMFKIEVDGIEDPRDIKIPDGDQISFWIKPQTTFNIRDVHISLPSTSTTFKIMLSLGEGRQHVISGFPRCLDYDIEFSTKGSEPSITRRQKPMIVSESENEYRPSSKPKTVSKPTLKLSAVVETTSIPTKEPQSVYNPWKSNYKLRKWSRKETPLSAYTNNLKLSFQDYIQQPVSFWPLSQPRKPCSDGYSRFYRDCSCGQEISVDLPLDIATTINVVDSDVDLNQLPPIQSAATPAASTGTPKAPGTSTNEPQAKALESNSNKPSSPSPSARTSDPSISSKPEPYRPSGGGSSGGGGGGSGGGGGGGGGGSGSGSGSGNGRNSSNNGNAGGSNPASPTGPTSPVTIQQNTNVSNASPRPVVLPAKFDIFFVVSGSDGVSRGDVMKAIPMTNADTDSTLFKKLQATYSLLRWNWTLRVWVSWVWKMSKCLHHEWLPWNKVPWNRVPWGWVHWGWAPWNLVPWRLIHQVFSLKTVCDIQWIKFKRYNGKPVYDSDGLCSYIFESLPLESDTNYEIIHREPPPPGPMIRPLDNQHIMRNYNHPEDFKNCSDCLKYAIPKYVAGTKLQGDRPEAWGLRAIEGISVAAFITQALAVLIIPVLSFTTLWLKFNNGDVQTAFVIPAIAIAMYIGMVQVYLAIAQLKSKQN